MPRGLLLRLGRKATSSDYVCRVTISDQVRQVVVELTRAILTKFQCVKVTERSVRVEVVEESQLARYVAHCRSLKPLKNTEPVKGQAMSSFNPYQGRRATQHQTPSCFGLVPRWAEVTQENASRDPLVRCPGSAREGALRATGPMSTSRRVFVTLSTLSIAFSKSSGRDTASQEVVWTRRE